MTLGLAVASLAVSVLALGTSVAALVLVLGKGVFSTHRREFLPVPDSDPKSAAKTLRKRLGKFEADFDEDA